MNFVEFPEFQQKCLVPIFLLLFLVRVHIFFTGQMLLCRGGRDPCGPPPLIVPSFPPTDFRVFLLSITSIRHGRFFSSLQSFDSPVFFFFFFWFFSSAGKGGLAAIYRVRRQIILYNKNQIVVAAAAALFIFFKFSGFFFFNQKKFKLFLAVEMIHHHFATNLYWPIGVDVCYLLKMCYSRQLTSFTGE